MISICNTYSKYQNGILQLDCARFIFIWQLICVRTFMQCETLLPLWLFEWQSILTPP